MSYNPNWSLAPRERGSFALGRYTWDIEGKRRLIRCLCGHMATLTPRDRLRRHHALIEDRWDVCQHSGAQLERVECIGRLVRDGWDIKRVPVSA